MDQKCASGICTLFEMLMRFQYYHFLLRYEIKLKSALQMCEVDNAIRDLMFQFNSIHDML